MTVSRRKMLTWAVRLLPFLIIAGLLIPGDHWVVREVRTFAGLITVLILPGYALARLLRLFDDFDNWLDALSLSAALAWGSGLVLWLAFFFLGVPLQIVSLIWLGLTVMGLSASTFVPLPRQLESRPTHPWLIAGIVIWILIVTGAVYLYGGRVDSDAYSYMTWLRNIRMGDIQPGVNIHASWEVNYPSFKNLYAPTLLYYAMTGFLARVDTNWIWTRAPTIWTPVMLAIQFSLTYQMFKRRSVGYATLFLVPLAGGLFVSRLGDSHSICNLILLPMAFWLFLQAVFAKRKVLWWTFPTATLIAIGLTFEHLPHIIHYLLVVGAFTSFYLLSRRRDIFWRSVILIAVVLLLIAPFIWHTRELASAYGYDPRQAAKSNLNMSRVQREERFLVLGDERFFIVRPQRLFSPLAALGAFLTVFYIRYLWQHEMTRLPIASFAIAIFVGLNPLLTPFLSRTIAPHVTYRLKEAMIIFPVLAYGVTRAALHARASWRHRRRVATGAAILLLTFAALVGYQLSQTSIQAVNEKIRAVIYSPAGVSTNLSDRLIRRILDDELELPPYPILDPPARLTRYLDAATLSYIKENIPSDSVFLSERLTEYNLPAYVDQLTYLGRLGWPEWGDICPRVRDEGAEAAFPTINRPEVYHRLDVSCAILDPDVDPLELDAVLEANRSEIDYILVTPNTAYLEVKLDQIMPQARIYSGDGFIIYALAKQDDQLLD